MANIPSIETFLARHKRVVKVTLSRVRGSSPRETGTEMLVASGKLWGTIGGGQLEFLAIERAREMLAGCEVSAHMDVPLGPEIGQCCGGRVEMTLNRLGKSDRKKAIDKYAQDQFSYPQIFVMGAGHVGRAIANILQHLPVKTILVDTRVEELNLCTANVETRLSVIPEFDVQSAPAGSAFIVLTHDHALDFLIASAALERGDAAYVGLIGSATKRAKFRNWCDKQCDGLTIDNLICPIGASGSRDKRPSVIAAFVAAEVIAEVTSETTAKAPPRGIELSVIGNHLEAKKGAANHRRQELRDQ